MQANPAYDISQNQAEGFTSSYFSTKHDDKRKELTYRIEKEINSEIQPPLRDISYRFAQGLTDTVYRLSEEEEFSTRRQALDYFDKEFMKREITRVKGNLTQYARDAFGAESEGKINNLRRNIYRKIEKHGLSGMVDSARPWKPEPLEERIGAKQYLGPEKVESTLSTTLSGYKDVIQPAVYENISRRIKEKSPLLAERISEYMPTPANRLKEILQTTEGMTNYNEAKGTFERQIIYDVLDATGFDKKKAARYLGDSLRTLNRRIADLGIEDRIKDKEWAKDEANNTARIEDFVKKKDRQEGPASAVNEIERFQQLVREYNAKRETARVEKQKEKRQKTNVNDMNIAA